MGVVRLSTSASCVVEELPESSAEPVLAAMGGTFNVVNVTVRSSVTIIPDTILLSIPHLPFRNITSRNISTQ